MNLIDAEAAAKGELVPYDPDEVRKAAQAAGVDLDVAKFRDKSFVGGYVTQGFRGYLALENFDSHERVQWLKKRTVQWLEGITADDEKAEARFQSLVRTFNELIASETQLTEIALKLTEIAGHAKKPPGKAQIHLPDIHADVVCNQVILSSTSAG